MMYLKQFPDICREMGFDVEEKAKIVTLRVTDINYSIDINKKLFLEDLELILALDKFHLAMLLNHICADSKNCPSSTTGWCEWLGNNWNSMT